MRLRDCETCGSPVPDRPYQAITARTCSPGCARDLAYRENPGLGGGGVWSERHKDQLEPKEDRHHVVVHR